MFDCSDSKAQSIKVWGLSVFDIKNSDEQLRVASVSRRLSGWADDDGITIECYGEVYVQIRKFGKNNDRYKQQKVVGKWQQIVHYDCEKYCRDCGWRLHQRINQTKRVLVMGPRSIIIHFCTLSMIYLVILFLKI